VLARQAAGAVLALGLCVSLGTLSSCSNPSPPAGGPTGASTAPASRGSTAAPPAPASSTSVPSAGATPTEVVPRPTGVSAPPRAGATASTSSTPASPLPPAGSSDPTATVAPKKVVTKPPVTVGKKVEVTGKVQVRVDEVTPVQAKARLPGEVSGPGVAVTVVVDNGSAAAVDLGNVVVTLTDSTGAPGGEVSDARAKPLQGSVAPRRSRTGSYFFTVPKSRRDPVSVSVTLSGSSPVAEFRGVVR
jgi:hypothetical protein